MNQRELERLAGRLGERAAARLNTEQVAAAVLARLRAERERPAPARPWWRASVTLRLAAAVAVLATGGVVARQVLRPTAATSVAMSAPILRDLSADELEEVFDSLALDAPVHTTATADLQTLNETELQELLRLLEG